MASWTVVLVAYVCPLLLLLTVFSINPTYIKPDATTPTLYCLEPPLCARRDLSLKQRVLCAMTKAPLHATSLAYRQYAVSRLQRHVADSMRGQPVAPAVVEWVQHKLYHAHEPTVLHFAGDNGVGKTRLAELISLALAQRCGNVMCTIGDTTLVLSGTAYDGMSVAEFRKTVVPVVARHARMHPHNGVVILNDLTSLEPRMVRVLAPLLGRGGNFPEFPEGSLTSLLVILTTDFGREGRTRGKSLTEMRTFIGEEFAELYSREAASFVRTFPFLPISLETAGDIVRVVVKELGCGTAPPLSLTISEPAVLWLVEKTKAFLSAENGRAVALETRLHVEALLEEAVLKEPSIEQTQAEPAADGGTASACPHSRCQVDLDPRGELVLVC